ncbi:MAG TPA: single-stranded DNA-binding protein [Firmicutes bacterium]|nr:single-stranded DNA-binding protein [Candidatus Fermentithermobacillaceae bacterium]
MLNRVILIGRLTKQPELRITPSSVSVTSFTLAVDRKPNQAGQKETDFIDVVIFGKLAEITCKYMDKGRLVAVEGRLQTRTFETKDGQKRKAWEVVADSIEFLSPRPRTKDETLNDVSQPEFQEDEEYDPEKETFKE